MADWPSGGRLAADEVWPTWSRHRSQVETMGATVSFVRSDTAFFHRPDVPRLIEKFSDQESIVIYAGAGVSIDRTGLSWKSLVDHLMERRIRDEAVRRGIMEANTPLEAASIACQLYDDMFPDSGPQHILNELRPLIYGERKWQCGELVKAVIRLSAALIDKGKSVCIVTTNFDGFLEYEARVLNMARLAAEKNEIDVESKVIKDTADDLHKWPQTQLQIAHLHGYISPSGGVDDTPVILSEVDYIHSQARSGQVLHRLFQDNAVLIVGSSLTDPPLLSALARSKPVDPGVTSNGPIRVAIMALQGVDFAKSLSGKGRGYSRKVVREFENKASVRMRQFGLKGIFPDFFSQVPQLLTEFRVCLELCGPVRSYVANSSGVRYGLRLSSWWNGWHEDSNEQLLKRQECDYERLRKSLVTIKHALDAEDEVMKLEVWLRWAPGEQNRQLRLWASSTGTWFDFESMRVAEIGASSKYAAVRAFCLGRPEIYSTRDDSNRWRTHLCVPIRINGDYDELPVGVISLVSVLPTDSTDTKAKASHLMSVINSGNSTGVWRAVCSLRELGLEIASTTKANDSD